MNDPEIALGKDKEEDGQLQFCREREINLLFTSCYLLVESARYQTKSGRGTSFRDELGKRPPINSFGQYQVDTLEASIKPSILVTFVEVISRLRWDEFSYIPLTRVRPMPSHSMSE